MHPVAWGGADTRAILQRLVMDFHIRAVRDSQRDENEVLLGRWRGSHLIGVLGGIGRVPMPLFLPQLGHAAGRYAGASPHSI